MAALNWIKLSVSLFNNSKIRYLLSQKNGDKFVLLWVLLLTSAGRCNDNGLVYLSESIPYTARLLASELGFSEKVAEAALDLFKQLGMIDLNSGFISIVGWDEHQSIDELEKRRASDRDRQQKHREKQKQSAAEKARGCHVTVTDMSRDSHGVEEEREKEKEKETDLEGECPPKSPKGESSSALFKRIVQEYGFSEELHGKLVEWMQYKAERRESYKETGLKSLLRQVENNAEKYGDHALCELIDLSMSNGWKGIIFDKLEEDKKKVQRDNRSQTSNIFFEMLQEEKVKYGTYL